MRRDQQYEFRRGKIVMKCPNCDKEHLRDEADVFTRHRRFVCGNKCAVLKPKEKYW